MIDINLTSHSSKFFFFNVYFLKMQFKALYNQQKSRSGADCGSDHELLIAKFRLKLKKIGKTIRPFGQVSRGSAGEYQADERAGVARLSWRVSGR